ncbi:hypothetical protein P280DRAFT_313775 [Massarina eburnea CBS 473.64]|uniref:Uncharacterized protein n=1 Tax=Massarina eburnea CBS 473.64 TaxID=1395130 RepID=A0A6A6S5L7_9PLEO|nr:hypothetical protein P280DRAFT_313775 [Massarina eburnea CBS 473.64]
MLCYNTKERIRVTYRCVNRDLVPVWIQGRQSLPIRKCFRTQKVSLYVPLVPLHKLKYVSPEPPRLSLVSPLSMFHLYLSRTGFMLEVRLSLSGSASRSKHSLHVQQSHRSRHLQSGSPTIGRTSVSHHCYEYRHLIQQRPFHNPCSIMRVANGIIITHTPTVHLICSSMHFGGI